MSNPAPIGALAGRAACPAWRRVGRLQLFWFSVSLQQRTEEGRQTPQRRLTLVSRCLPRLTTHPSPVTRHPSTVDLAGDWVERGLEAFGDQKPELFLFVAVGYHRGDGAGRLASKDAVHGTERN
jgi:hypothetical protein